VESIRRGPEFNGYPDDCSQQEEGQRARQGDGQGWEDIGKRAAKGSADLAKGAGKGVGNLATGHPAGAAASVGKGVGGLGKNVAVGSRKGVGKIGKGVGGEVKKLGHKSEKKHAKAVASAGGWQLASDARQLSRQVPLIHLPICYREMLNHSSRQTRLRRSKYYSLVIVAMVPSSLVMLTLNFSL